MNLKPIKGKVVLERLETKEDLGGIVLPETSKEKSTTGIVIAVSEESMGIKTNDKVIFPKWGGSEFEHEGRKLLVIKAEEILAILG
jgi:chaperonin GroES